MFNFKPSKALAHRILDNLTANGISLPQLLTADVELLRSAWGDSFVGTVGIFAQRTRHEIYQSTGAAPDTFVLVKDGNFPEEIGNHIGGVIPIPEGEIGDEIIRELASEFTEWVAVHGASHIHPQAPVTLIEVVGSDVVVHVRPYVPIPKDPNFVRATVIE